MSTRRTPLVDISNNDMTSSPATTGARRKSGRTVKAPEKFIPEVSSSQVAPPSVKRKRGQEDVENDASDSEEDDEESEEEVESAGEEELKDTRRKGKTAKKPATKKVKVNGTAPRKATSSAPSVKAPSRSRKGKGKKVLIADREADGLYAEVFTSGKHVDDVVGEFLSQYAENSPAALTDLINMVLKSAGCNTQVTEDDINDTDNVDGRLGELQGEFQAQNIANYPLIHKSKGGLDFRNALVNFFVSLIQAMDKSGILYNDPALIENIHIWLATMSSSTSRPFRHTATLLCMALTSAMCSLARAELDTAAKVRQMASGEKSRGAGNKARIAQFQKNISASEDKKEFLSEHIKDFFDAVYVHRYRDIDPKIRAECVQGLGTWIRTLTDEFGTGEYLRYMGWMMSDSQSLVRHEVVKQLHEIMKNQTNHAMMVTFIERFRPRLIEIATRDSEPSVRSLGVELAESIREAGMLEPDDIDVIGKLIYDSEAKVRNAVVDFFISGVEEVYEGKVQELGGEDELEVLADNDEDLTAPRKEWIKLKTLAEVLASYDTEDQDEDPSQLGRAADVEFLSIAGQESRFTLAAQALYEKLPEIRDWDMVASYLLFDHSAKASGSKSLRAIKGSFKPTEKEEVILLETLNATVKLGLTHVDVSDNSKSRKTLREELSEIRENTARRLADLIPKLLKKFGALPRTATVILRLEHVLNLGVFQELRQDSTAYSKLLDEISSQFSAHADRGVLDEASAALLHAKGYEELEEVTESKMQNLWDDTIEAFKKIYGIVGGLDARGSFNEPVLEELSHTLARLDKLASISDCVGILESDIGLGTVLPIHMLLETVARGTFTEPNPDDLDALEDEVVLSAMRASLFYFMWKVRSLTSAIAAGETIPQIDVDNLKESQDLFITNLISALSSRATLDPIRLFGSGTLLDLHVLFSTLRPSKDADAVSDENEHLQDTIKEIEPVVQTELASIFGAAEKQFAKRARKKLEEPGEDEEPEDPEDEAEEDEEEDITESERRSEILKAEQQLCELTGKLVLAILAKVIDAKGPLKGKLTARIQRNVKHLGPNFKDVVAHLDEKKPKSKGRSHKSKIQEAVASTNHKSKEIVEEDEEGEEEDDPFAEPEENSAEDLRRRELADEDALSHSDEAPAENGDGGDEDDDMIGD